MEDRTPCALLRSSGRKELRRCSGAGQEHRPEKMEEEGI